MNGQSLDELLNELRLQGDAPADRLMAEIIEDGGSFLPVPALLANKRTEEFIRQHSVLPNWADLDKIARGQELFYRYGMTIVTLLFFSALPEGYACGNPARVLAYTGKLNNDREVLKRILRTAQFIIDVMEPGGLSAGGRGIESTLQIRLLHAAIRADLGRANYSCEHGIINQEELAGTMNTFSILMLDGMKKYQHDFTEEEEEAYVHVWNVVGHIIGVDKRLLCDSPAEARVLFHRIKTRIQSPCAESNELTRALLNFLHEMIPGTLFDGFADTLMRHSIGDDLANRLNIASSDWTENTIPLLRGLGYLSDTVGDHSELAQDVFQNLYRKLILGLLDLYKREPDNRSLHIKLSDELRERWAISQPT